MPQRSRGFFTVATLSLAVVAAVACSKDEETKGSPAAASASAAAAAVPATSVPEAASAVPPAASAAASAAPRTDCPKGSAGPGTFKAPCEAKGNARLMEVTWTGKNDDKGPHFRVTNKSPRVIVYGKLAVYFYDKAGKQLEVEDTAATPPKKVPYRTCSGNMFSGVMKPGEKAVLTFSCVKAKHVPEGTAAIEAEMQGVGFADASDEKKVDFYWRNNDLVSDVRKKGGAKKK